jgi:hypothetical protein
MSFSITLDEHKPHVLIGQALWLLWQAPDFSSGNACTKKWATPGNSNHNSSKLSELRVEAAFFWGDQNLQNRLDFAVNQSVCGSN